MDITRLRTTAVIHSALFLLIIQPIAAQTRQYLDAPVVKSNIRVRLSGKELQWAADEDSRFRSLQSDALFLTKRSVFVSYPRMNPLKIQASASAKAVDDPAAATIGKLVESIAKVGTTLAPNTADAGLRDAGAAALRAMNAPFGLRDAPPFACDASASAEGNIKALSSLLYGEDSTAKTVGSHVSDWTNQIDQSFRSGKSGPTTMADVATSIKAVMDGLTSNIEAAKKISAKISECASDSWKPADSEIRQARQKQLYLAASLTKATTDTRVRDLQSLKAALAQLIETLGKQYGAEDKWIGAQSADFQISDEIGPTFEKMQTVSVKVVSVTFKVDDASSALNISQQETASGTFSVRRYSLLTPEIGVGVVFGAIKQPKYGTDKNAQGQTIVARVPDTSLSIAPSVLVNFVCRCSTGALVPMFQIGAATSKDLPGILGGVGIRLFGLGKGDVAIGGGAMFGWVKDLQKLKSGDVVGGTKDIDADLGYSGRPKIGSYFVIQYKF